MSARTKARKRAIDILFQADVRGTAITEVLAVEAERALHEPDRRASWEYASEIVEGVNEQLSVIDEKIAGTAEGWTLDRMPNYDRAALRVATWEILFNSEVPSAVAINEVLNLVNDYSTADSGRFVNGVLGRIAELNEL